MSIYVTINEEGQIGIINENTIPPTKVWFFPDMEVDLLVKALREAQRYLHDKPEAPRWNVK